MNYRNPNGDTYFQESNFNIILMTEQGEFVHARYGKRFTFSLLNIKENITLKPGKYIVMVDPLWNETADNDAMYREVLLDIYAPETVDLDQVSDDKGMQCLEKAMKHAAKKLATKTPNGEDSRQFYLEENEDYAEDVYRISDVESLGCWYGFIYTMNGSKYQLNETLRPNLEGLEVVYPALSGDDNCDVELDIPAGKDHVVILRRTHSSCTYGMQYLTHPRSYSDQEIEEITKGLDDEDTNYFGDQKDALYKLHNSAQCACFYFYNGSRFTL